MELAKDPAYVARVHRQVPHQVGGGGFLAMRQFVQHARLAERELALEEAFVEHADLLGVEAVEPAHRI